MSLPEGVNSEPRCFFCKPGWDRNAQVLGEITDVRALQGQLKDKGMVLLSEVDENSAGPGNFLLTFPDGSPILINQHV